jgi:hypothetical protein
MTPKNLIELIKVVKPRTALFTTYTISIAFIEGVLLPTLRRVGCIDVAILVDANEAAKSLEEAQSESVGRKYRLAPVIAPGRGIFHPKVAYFCGAEYDVLSIGSGNLTLSGQSKQLECLDVVRSDHYPGVFMDFAVMAKDLANKISGTSKQASELLRFVEGLAKTASNSSNRTVGSFPIEPRLVHTVNAPASQQLIQLCEDQAFQATDVTVLSPFHAPDGGPILKLKDELGAGKLHVGLDRATLIAPFEEKRLKASKELDFVVPKIGNDQRHLHAKVFQISDEDSSIVMTGSINATSQSLNSTMNVEISLARLVPKESFTWEKATPSRFEPRTFIPTQREVEFAYLEATLALDGKISGQVSCAKATPAHAVATLIQAQETVNGDEIHVQIQSSGTFSFMLPFEICKRGAVQLALSSQGFLAQCWLTIEEDLTSTDEERREKQAIRHILAGEFGDEDVFELFQILTRATQQTTAQRSAEKNAAVKSDEMSNAEKDQKFSYVQWKNSNLRNPQKGLLGIHGVDTLKAFLRWLNNSGLQAGTTDNFKNKEVKAGHRPDFELVDDSEVRSQSFDLQGGLREIIQAIPVVLSQNRKFDAAAILAVVSGAYALKLSLNSPWRDERACKPLLSWLDEFSRFEYAETGHETLLKFALGASAVVVGIARKYSAHSPVAFLKDSLIRFSPQWMAQVPKQAELDSSLSDEIFSRLPVHIRTLASTSLVDILNATSMDERIEALVTSAGDSRYAATDEDEHAFPSGVAGIRRLMQVDRRRRHHGIVLNERQLDSSGCPHCYQAFGDAFRLELRAKHLIACPHSNCKKPIFYFEDKAVQERVMETINNA